MLCATGVFLALLGIYVLTAPGRIDIIDGQWRYEVAKNWLDTGEPAVADRWLLATRLQMLNPRNEKSYSVYNAGPSVTPMPLMLLSRLLPGHKTERDHLAFSLTGPFFGALLGALLLLAYGLLGIRLCESLIYTAIFCLATLWWPASVTVFDQNQHAVFLLGAVLVAWQAGRRQSLRLAALAGLLAGLLLNYQETYALLLAALGLPVLAPPQEGEREEGARLHQLLDRAALLRYLTFGLCCSVGLGLFFAFNAIRFGAPVALAKYGSHTGLTPPTWGDPLAGFLSLAISPGKGVLWFSPPLVLALLGARGLSRRVPELALAVGAVSVCHLLLVVHLSFFGGDWCWGPRYLIPVMPLWALAFPFATVRLRRPRLLLAPLVMTGLLVQMLGISLDQHRFFYERNLPANFWATAPWFYFRDSQLIARPGEVLASLTSGPPEEAKFFNCALTGQATYCPAGIRHPADSSSWMRQFQIFYLPRPWWGWMGRIAPAERPVDPAWLTVACAVLLAMGSLLLAKSLHSRPLDIRHDGRSLWLPIADPRDPIALQKSDS